MRAEEKNLWLIEKKWWLIEKKWWLIERNVWLIEKKCWLIAEKWRQGFKFGFDRGFKSCISSNAHIPGGSPGSL